MATTIQGLGFRPLERARNWQRAHASPSLRTQGAITGLLLRHLN